MNPIELFLRPPGEAEQTLPSGLNTDALAETGAKPTQGDDKKGAKSYLDPTGHMNSIRDQGWGVIAPRGEAGDRLLSLVAPLLAKRLEDLDDDDLDEIDVYRVPPDMTHAQAVQWVDRKLVGNRSLREIPGYVCILGGPELVSFELQQVLSTGFAAGRIAFDRDEHYRAYVDKLLRWERQEASASARALFFTARDGTPATELGYQQLMRPTVDDVSAQAASGQLALDQVQSFDRDDALAMADELLATAAQSQPSVLMSCSHGMGAPRRGWGDEVRQRAMQGALCLGQDEVIDANELASGPFLPGGMWFLFACFGLGTPRHSAYHHWLSRLKELGEFGQHLDAVLHSLPQAGQPGFLAALPRAVLANPDGPLAVVGHLDLAWSYGFQDIEKMSNNERHRRFELVLNPLLRGQRAGLALSGLQRAREQVKSDLLIATDDHARADTTGAPAADDAIRLGHRWMLHHDLDGYILLGDPAAKLTVTPSQRRRRRRPAPAVTTPPSPQPAVTLTAPAPAPAGETTSVADMEAAVHALIEGEGAKALAAQYGVDKRTIQRWHEVYTSAGQAALEALRD